MIYALLAPLLFFSAGKAAEKNIFTVRTVSGESYFSLHELTEAFHADAAFDHQTQKGRIYYKTHQVSYVTGFSYIILDGKLRKSPQPVIRAGGEVLFPLIFLEPIVSAFSPQSVLTFEQKRVTAVIRSEGRVPVKKERDAGKKETRDKISFIIIDAGHGGKDPGAMGRGGMKEKIITLKIARYLEESLKADLKGTVIVMTRPRDSFVELSRRAEIANGYLKEGANGVFISIHVNASLSPKTSGFETYFLSQNPTNEEARNTAALENDVVVYEEKKGKKFMDADYIEAMMLTTQIQKESSLLADSVQKGMGDIISPKKSRGVRKADFFVLRGALMPAVLVEVGFITHKKESLSLMDGEYQKRIARGIAGGVVRFMKKYNASVNR